MTWNEVPSAAAYELASSQSAAMADAVVTEVKEQSADLTDLKSGKTYHLRVRALDSRGNPISDWSPNIAAEVPEPMPIRVASYNIKCANCKGGASWSKRRHAVAATILGEMPDVLGLQGIPGEDEGTEGLAVRRPAQPARVALPGHQPGPGASGAVRIFYNSETVELLDQGAKKLPHDRSSNQQRYLSWAKFRVKKTGSVFLFGDTHLEPGKKVGNLRRRQAQTIVGTLKALGSDDLPTIVVGDLNSYRWMPDGNKPYDVLTRAGFEDPLGMTYKSRGSRAPGAFVEERINTRYSSYNDFKRKAPKLGHINGTYLDYILVTPMRVSEWETVVKVDSSGRFIGTIPSDHNLVRADVWLP